MKENLFLYNSDHFRTYSGKQYTPIVEPCRASSGRKIFLPLELNHADFKRLAAIADEAGRKLTTGLRGGWNIDPNAPKCLLRGMPEWRVHRSTEGLLSIWTDLRAASLTEEAYRALYCRAQEDFSRFVDEISRNGGDQTAAAQVADAKFLTVDPAQRMPEKE